MNRTQLRILIYTLLGVAFVAIIIFAVVYNHISRKKIERVKTQSSNRSDISIKIDLLKKEIFIKGWYQDYSGYFQSTGRWWTGSVTAIE